MMAEPITREIDPAEVLPVISTRVRDLERTVRIWRRAALVFGLAFLSACWVAAAG